MKIKDLQDLLKHDLMDTYDAERQLTEALPKMAEAASSSELRAAFEHHLEQTNNHMMRLEQIFDMLGESPDGEECIGMRGLIQEGEKLIEEQTPGEALDAALIGAAQKVEHYEITAYGSMRAYARLLGEDSLDGLLMQTLDEEGKAGEKLTQIAMTSVNLESIGD